MGMSPYRSKKEFLKKVRAEREEFQVKKEKGIVSVEDLRIEKQNAEIEAKQLYLRLMKSDKKITDIFLDMKMGIIDLPEMKNHLSDDSLELLEENILRTIERLNMIHAALFVKGAKFKWEKDFV